MSDEISMIPPGWRLVPEVLTDEMRCTLADGLAIDKAWAALLAAADPTAQLRSLVLQSRIGGCEDGE